MLSRVDGACYLRHKYSSADPARGRLVPQSQPKIEVGAKLRGRDPTEVSKLHSVRTRCRGSHPLQHPCYSGRSIGHTSSSTGRGRAEFRPSSIDGHSNKSYQNGSRVASGADSRGCCHSPDRHSSAAALRFFAYRLDDDIVYVLVGAASGGERQDEVSYCAARPQVPPQPLGVPQQPRLHLRVADIELTSGVRYRLAST